MIITSRSTFTLPAGSAAVFKKGGSGKATVFLPSVPGQIYTVGVNEAFLGPYEKDASISVGVDYGSVEYIIDSTGSDHSDLAPAIAAISERLSQAIVSVKDFGAVGDGVTDDYSAIAAAIAMHPGKVIKFPPGDYAISQPIVLSDNTYLHGDRLGYGYINKFTARLSPTVAMASMVTSSGAIGNAGVCGIDFRGRGLASKGIHFPNATWCQIRNVFMDDFLDQFILIDAGVANTIDNFLGTNGLRNAVRVADAGSIEVSGSDHILNNIETSAGWGTPLTGGYYRAGVLVKAASCFLSSVIGELSEVGIKVTGNSNRLVACRGDKNRTHGVHVTGVRNQLTACEAGNNSNDASDTHYGFFNTGRSNTYSGCRVYSPGGGVHRYAFYDSVTGGDQKTKTIWSGCNGEYGSGGMFYSEPFDGVSPLIHQAKRADGNLTTIDVAGISIVALYQYNTPTTVVAFSGGVTGQLVTFISSNTNVTIQNNASIFTNTGANKTLAANRSYQYTFFDGKWYEQE